MKIRITFKPVVNTPDKELEADSWYVEGGWIRFEQNPPLGSAIGEIVNPRRTPVAVYDMWAILGFEVIG